MTLPARWSEPTSPSGARPAGPLLTFTTRSASAATTRVPRAVRRARAIPTCTGGVGVAVPMMILSGSLEALCQLRRARPVPMTAILIPRVGPPTTAVQAQERVVAATPAAPRVWPMTPSSSPARPVSSVAAWSGPGRRRARPTRDDPSPESYHGPGEAVAGDVDAGTRCSVRCRGWRRRITSSRRSTTPTLSARTPRLPAPSPLPLRSKTSSRSSTWAASVTMGTCPRTGVSPRGGGPAGGDRCPVTVLCAAIGVGAGGSRGRSPASRRRTSPDGGP